MVDRLKLDEDLMGIQLTKLDLEEWTNAMSLTAYADAIMRDVGLLKQKYVRESALVSWRIDLVAWSSKKTKTKKLGHLTTTQRRNTLKCWLLCLKSWDEILAKSL
ncbi:hypothetical protein Tco_0163143 [Tanacetum coccineum]